jgi:hypothetical protein
MTSGDVGRLTLPLRSRLISGPPVDVRLNPVTAVPWGPLALLGHGSADANARQSRSALEK